MPKEKKEKKPKEIKNCKPPKERVGKVKKNGQKACILPCDKLKNPRTRSDCKDYADQVKPKQPKGEMTKEQMAKMMKGLRQYHKCAKEWCGGDKKLDFERELKKIKKDKKELIEKLKDEKKKRKELEEKKQAEIHRNVAEKQSKGLAVDENSLLAELIRKGKEKIKIKKEQEELEKKLLTNIEFINKRDEKVDSIEPKIQKVRQYDFIDLNKVLGKKNMEDRVQPITNYRFKKDKKGKYQRLV